MHIKIKDVEFDRSDLTKVAIDLQKSIEFTGLVFENKGQQRIDNLRSINESNEIVQCNVRERQGLSYDGKGRLKDFESKTEDGMIRFSGEVTIIQ